MTNSASDPCHFSSEEPGVIPEGSPDFKNIKKILNVSRTVTVPEPLTRLARAPRPKNRGNSTKCSRNLHDILGIAEPKGRY